MEGEKFHGYIVLSHFSHVQLFVTPPALLHPWDSLGENTGVGCHFLFQGIRHIKALNIINHL